MSAHNDVMAGQKSIDSKPLMGYYVTQSLAASLGATKLLLLPTIPMTLPCSSQEYWQLLIVNTKTGSDGHQPPPRKTKRWMWTLGGDPSTWHVTPFLMSLMFTYPALFPASLAFCSTIVILSTIHCFLFISFTLWLYICFSFYVVVCFYSSLSGKYLQTSQLQFKYQVSCTTPVNTCSWGMIATFLLTDCTLYLFVSQLSWYI